MEELLAAVDRAFADPPDVDVSGGCCHCNTEADVALLSGDLDLVPTGLVYHALIYSVSYLPSEQWQPLWRRLAPNAVRLLAHDRGDDWSDWALSRLAYADLPAWPEVERVALENAFAGILETALTHGDTGENVSKLVDGLACAYDDIAPWLARIDAITDPRADEGVVRLVHEWIEVLWSRLHKFEWWRAGDANAIMRAWLCSAAVRERVDRYEASHPDDETVGYVQLYYNAHA